MIDDFCPQNMWLYTLYHIQIDTCYILRHIQKHNFIYSYSLSTNFVCVYFAWVLSNFVTFALAI